MQFLKNLYSSLYTIYYNTFQYLPQNNNFKFTEINNNGSLIVLKENIKDINFPTLVIIPGTTGDTENKFLADIVDVFYENNYNVIFILQQGQKKTKYETIPINKPHFVSMTDISGVEFAMDYILTNYTNKVYMLGCSFGAILMKKYLYKQRRVEIGVSVASPWNLQNIFDQWNTNYIVKYVFDYHFTRHYKNMLLSNIAIFEQFEKENPKFSITRFLNSKDLKELLSNLNTYYYGYNSMDDYINDSKVELEKIKYPILFIHAKDDTICSIKNMPNISEPHQTYITETGGHISYLPNIGNVCLKFFQSIDNDF